VTSRTRTALTGALVAGGVAVIHQLQRQRQSRGSVAPSRVITIGKPVQQVEQAWHDPTLRGMVFAAVPHLAEQVSARCRPATPESWGTEVTLVADTGGAAGAVASAMPRLTAPVLLKLLLRFKAVVETGEIPTLTRNPAARHRAIEAA
jgi:hypothetical protein